MGPVARVEGDDSRACTVGRLRRRSIRAAKTACRPPLCASFHRRQRCVHTGVRELLDGAQRLVTEDTDTKWGAKGAIEEFLKKYGGPGEDEIVKTIEGDTKVPFRDFGVHISSIEYSLHELREIGSGLATEVGVIADVQ